MLSAKELKKKFDEDLESLQETCKHEDVSDWIEHYWTAGHASGYQVKQCNFCWKILKNKTNCVKCFKEFTYIDDEIDELPVKLKYYSRQNCPECVKKYKELNENS